MHSVVPGRVNEVEMNDMIDLVTGPILAWTQQLLRRPCRRVSVTSSTFSSDSLVEASGFRFPAQAGTDRRWSHDAPGENAARSAHSDLTHKGTAAIAYAGHRSPYAPLVPRFAGASDRWPAPTKAATRELYLNHIPDLTPAAS